MQLVLQHKEKVTTTSVLVAEKFGKEHKNVLRAIEDMECSPEFWRLNFEPSTYMSRGKEYKMYIMTRDGFTFLVMSFTGETAAKFKEEYINAFNNMEAIIRSQTPTLLPTYSERILSEPCHDVPKGYWTVFDKCHPIMIFIEKHIGSINKFDIVDGSIGSRWATYRKDKPWYSDEDMASEFKRGQDSIKEHVAKLHETNVALSQAICENLVFELMNLGIKCKRVHLNAENLYEFKAIVVIPSRTFLSPKQFKSITDLSGEFYSKHNKEDYYISFYFIPHTNEINKDALVSDGYRYTFVNE